MITASDRRNLSVTIPALLFMSLFASHAAAAVAIDVNVSVNQSTAKITVASPAFSTTAGNELLLAFVSTDYLSGANTQVSSVSGGGLTWAPVVRANGQSGTSEIWRASARPVSTAGSTPAPPAVGAATMTPIAALTSCTASARASTSRNGPPATGASDAPVHPTKAFADIVVSGEEPLDNSTNAVIAAMNRVRAVAV